MKKMLMIQKGKKTIKMTPKDKYKESIKQEIMEHKKKHMNRRHLA